MNIKTILSVIFTSCFSLSITACNAPAEHSHVPVNSNIEQTNSEAEIASPEQTQTDDVNKNSKSSDEITNPSDSNNHQSIVVYYSRTGDNYSVGNITIGNTAKVAAEIAKQTGADLVEIKPVKDYPAVYKECTDVAKQELNEHARPAIATTVENFEQYHTVYIGYPMWWGDAPMVVYTFLDNHAIDSKTLIPFATHEGSGLANTPYKLQKAYPKAIVKDGLEITGSVAQNNPEEVQKQVSAFLKKK